MLLTAGLELCPQLSGVLFGMRRGRSIDEPRISILHLKPYFFVGHLASGATNHILRRGSQHDAEVLALLPCTAELLMIAAYSVRHCSANVDLSIMDWQLNHAFDVVTNSTTSDQSSELSSCTQLENVQDLASHPWRRKLG